MTRNQLQYQANLEIERSNRAREQEQHRSNVRNEALTATNISETTRANKAREKENERHNRVQEGVAIANAVTDGVSNVAKGAGSILGSVL